MSSAPRKKRDAKPARRQRKSPAKAKAAKTAGRASRAAAEASPHEKANGSGDRVSVRVYCQGLGDCILVRVKRKGTDDFKLLIDCGVVIGTKNAATIMTGVVENLVEDTGKKVDVLAITHEHWDHLSGFIQAADSFAKLSVGSVWVAWTEKPDDKLASELRTELGKAKTALRACASAFRAAGDDATHKTLADIALTPLGAAADTSTRAAFDKAKAMATAGTTMWLPTDDPFPIPGANARIYALGPPHDPKLIRKINPSTRSPETYGLAMNGGGALPMGVVAALAENDEEAPFHERVTIKLDAKGQPDTFDDPRLDNKHLKAVQKFFHEHYYGRDDWRRIDHDWLGPASELALALQSYTNNTSLVLALELGDVGKGDVLLFAGDAQVGNWESWQALQWPKDAPKVTGPDLLKRTIFYKVGHHGSHNATLRDHGLEQMIVLKTAIIPVDEVEAKLKHWDKMPLPQLIEALEKKDPPVVVLRTDKKPAEPPDNVVIGDNYFEIRL